MAGDVLYRVECKGVAQAMAGDVLYHAKCERLARQWQEKYFTTQSASA